MRASVPFVSLLKPLDSSMLTDAEWEELITVDPDDEVQLVSVIVRFILPEYESMDPQSRQMIRGGLSTALAQPDFDYRVILERLELPFIPMEQPRSFFLQLWRTLHGADFG